MTLVKLRFGMASLGERATKVGGLWF